MMINKRLINTVSESKKYIAGNILCQWGSLVANIGIIFSMVHLLEKLSTNTANKETFVQTLIVIAIAIGLRFGLTLAAAKMSFQSSKSVKQKLRQMIYQKLLRLGVSYNEKIATSEIVQVSVEGVEQLETYFGAYLPQFFYSLLAPLTLFAVLSSISFSSAIGLLLCVPLIPITIAAIQTFAKKLLAKYWGQYTTLGDTFLENLQGLTTLKIYQADEFKHQEMNRESEKFRKVTMKVLIMQLNSVTIMDIIAYGGAALGIVLSVSNYRAGTISIGGCLAIILLSAEFFIPMRLLGSYFHIAMNGMAASDKIFKLLDLPEPDNRSIAEIPKTTDIRCRQLNFAYTPERPTLKNLNLDFPVNSFTAIVGESGSGKSTIAGLLTGKNQDYTGEIKLGSIDLTNLKEDTLLRTITYIGHDSYLFKGTVLDNLLLANPAATESELWSVLERVNLADFLHAEQGLATLIMERAANLSGGQRQRLALARAILHDSPIYIFDEATSNIDVESENDIMTQIQSLAKQKTVILITHRLANAVDSDCIYVLQDGLIVESGKHTDLLAQDKTYAKLWNQQSQLENYRKGKTA